MTKPRRGIRLAAPQATDTPDPAPAPPVEYHPDTLYHLPVGLLARDPDQPRVDFEPAALAALAADLVASGQQSPVTFRTGCTPEGAVQLYLVHGERRWRASQLAGLPTIAAILDAHAGRREATADRILRQATDNDLHERLSPWDWACMVKRLTEPPCNMTVGAIAAALEQRQIPGKSRPVISTLLALHRLPAWAIDHLRAGRLTVAHGKYLLPHIERPEIIDPLEQWIGKTLKTLPAAVTDDVAEEGEASIARQRDAEHGANGLSVSAMRAEITRCYDRAYISLKYGKWVDQVRLGAHFDHGLICAPCPRRIDITGDTGRIGYCPDPDCMARHNAEIDAAQCTQDKENDRAWEEQRRADIARIHAKAAADIARIRAKAAAETAQRAAILAALSCLTSAELTDIVLWRLVPKDYGQPKEVLENATIQAIRRRHLANPGQHASWLLKILQNSLAHYTTPEDWTALAEAIGITAADLAAIPVPPVDEEQSHDPDD